jgi:DNA-binding XRE family transcriptional regulator
VDIRVPRPNIRINPRAKYKIGEHVKRKRLELGMDQEDVATFLGIDIHTLIAWEHGTVPLKRQTPKIVEFLGYDPYEIAAAI